MKLNFPLVKLINENFYTMFFMSSNYCLGTKPFPWELFLFTHIITLNNRAIWFMSKHAYTCILIFSTFCPRLRSTGSEKAASGVLLIEKVQSSSGRIVNNHTHSSLNKKDWPSTPDGLCIGRLKPFARRDTDNSGLCRDRFCFIGSKSRQRLEGAQSAWSGDFILIRRFQWLWGD